MTTSLRPCSSSDIVGALAAVTDPELDEPITAMGFVRSIEIDDGGLVVHLRLPAAFYSQNSVYLLVSDTLDALRCIEDIGRVSVILDDHHDSDRINACTAADEAYLATFGSEAGGSLHELRNSFLSKAHSAAVERSVAVHLSREGGSIGNVGSLTLRDIRGEKYTISLLRRRSALGLSICPNSRVVVDERGTPIAAADIPMKLRLAQALRLSITGNAHFCSALPAARYGNAEQPDTLPHITDIRTRRSG